MDDIVPTTNDRDSYFLNFSDGMPMFSNDDVSYNWDVAINHTKKMVNLIREKGIKVLSYFVSDSNYDGKDSVKDFKTMYGKDAEFIDVTSVLSVAKTMNKKPYKSRLFFTFFNFIFILTIPLFVIIIYFIN